MAITWRTATADNKGTASTTHTVTKPTGLANGDVVYIILTTNGATVTSVPSSFTALYSMTTQANPKSYVYRKVITNAAGEPAWDFGLSSSVTSGSVCYAGIGIDNTTPENALATAATGSTGSGTMTVTGITTTVNDCVLLYAMFVNSSTNALTAPTGMTEIAENGARKHELDSLALPTAGATGNKAGSAASNTLAWNATMWAVQPAAGGGNTPQASSETGTLSDTESSSLAAQAASSETGTLATSTNASTASATATSSETGTLSDSEASTGAAAATSSETGTISATESSLATIQQVSSETGTLSDTESDSLAATAASTESGSMATSTNASTAAATTASSETGSLATSINASTAAITGSSGEVGTISTSEASTVLVKITVADTGTISATELSAPVSTASGPISVFESARPVIVTAFTSDDPLVRPAFESQAPLIVTAFTSEDAIVVPAFGSQGVEIAEAFASDLVEVVS